VQEITSRNSLYENWKEMPGKEIHFTISPHLNHRHVKEFLFAGPHFFDVQFPGRFKIGITPDVNLAIAFQKG